MIHNAPCARNFLKVLLICRDRLIVLHINRVYVCSMMQRGHALKRAIDILTTLNAQIVVSNLVSWRYIVYAHETSRLRTTRLAIDDLVEQRTLSIQRPHPLIVSFAANNVTVLRRTAKSPRFSFGVFFFCSLSDRDKR